MPDPATVSVQFYADFDPRIFRVQYTTRSLVSADGDATGDVYILDNQTGANRLITVDHDISIYPGTPSLLRDWDDPRLIITSDGGDSAPTRFFSADYGSGHVSELLTIQARPGWVTRLAGIGADNSLFVSQRTSAGAADLFQYDATGHLVWSDTIGDYAGLKVLPDGRYGLLYEGGFDENGQLRITQYARLDLLTHERIDLLSRAGAGPYHIDSYQSALSHDGRLFLFVSDDDSIVPGDDNGTYDVFVRDVLTGETILVSTTEDGTPGNAFSSLEDYDAIGIYYFDGRAILFRSDATDLAAPFNPDYQAYEFSLPQRFWQSRPINSLLSFTATTDAENLVFNAGDGSSPVTLPSQNGKVVFSHRYAADGDFNLSFNSVAPDLAATSAGYYVRVRAFATQGVTVAGVGGSDIMLLSPFADLVAGGAGDDVLFGFDGADSLDGGSGADRMYGGFGDDIYGVENGGDLVVESELGGTDTVKTNLDGYVLGANVENLTLTGSGNTTATGNDLNNVMIGNGGNNTLNSGKGDDQLYGGAGDDILNSGTGADRMYGGAGNDIYYYGVGDTIIEAADAGIDTVYASVNFTIGSTLENLVLIGDRAINGTGNNLGNRMQGNDQANVLQGGRGNDALYGQGGDDILIGGRDADTLGGGAGADTFRFDVMTDSLVAGADTIIDYQAGLDRLDLSRLDADTATAGDQAFHQVTAFTHQAGELTLSFDAGTNRTTLSLDMNGDGNADMAILFVGNVNLTSGWVL